MLDARLILMVLACSYLAGCTSMNQMTQNWGNRTSPQGTLVAAGANASPTFGINAPPPQYTAPQTLSLSTPTDSAMTLPPPAVGPPPPVVPAVATNVAPTKLYNLEPAPERKVTKTSSRSSSKSTRSVAKAAAVKEEVPEVTEEPKSSAAASARAEDKPAAASTVEESDTEALAPVPVRKGAKSRS